VQQTLAAPADVDADESINADDDGNTGIDDDVSCLSN
jgi:hypothetical protein